MVLRPWEQKALEAEIRGTASTSHTVAKFTVWWDEMRGKLVEVLPDQFVPAPEEGPTWVQWIPGVAIEPDRLRRLLKDINFKLMTVY